MFSLFNFSSIFPGGQLTPFAPMCGRPCSSGILACFRNKLRDLHKWKFILSRAIFDPIPTEFTPLDRSPKNVANDYVGDFYGCAKFVANPSTGAF